MKQARESKQVREAFTTEEIIIPDRLRGGLNEQSITALIESIGRIGLQIPITVRWDKDEDGYATIVLVAGHHRLEAYKRLDIALIDCVVFDGTDLEARLWEIAENLHRAELTVLERSEHIAEWVRLTEENLGGPSWAGQLDARGQRKSPQQQPSGINAAVLELPGVTRQEAQRSVKITALAPEAKAAAKAAGIDDNQSALLRVKAAGENVADQVAAVAREKTKKPETKEKWLKSGMKWWKRAGAAAWQREFMSAIKELETQ